MIILLSPSKTLDFESPVPAKTHTVPEMLKESGTLIRELRKYTPEKLGKLMDISDKLAEMNARRYKDFRQPFTPDNARQALLAFKGDVYAPMNVGSYTPGDFAFAQDHIRILSGLYGLLRPLDLIQPYRLEMGTALPTKRGKSLYEFWGDRSTKMINESIVNHKNKTVINLASVEYFHSVQPEKLDGALLNIHFKEKHKGTLKVIGVFAKKARGIMADYVIKHRIEDANKLKKFNESGYAFQPGLSDDKNWIFIR